MCPDSTTNFIWKMRKLPVKYTATKTFDNVSRLRFPDSSRPKRCTVDRLQMPYMDKNYYYRYINAY